MVWGQCVGIGVEIAIGPVFCRRIISEGETEIQPRTTYAITKRGESVRHLFVLHIVERYRCQHIRLLVRMRINICRRRFSERFTEVRDD
jgi:hypothetical protein